jgi:effector-binding domain-containing protein
MRVETVEIKSQPMLYVTRSSSMAPEEISGVMQEAFGAIGAFIGRTGITPTGPPLAVYRDWDSATGNMKIDIGFPVTAPDAARADGEVKSGETPAGKALKTIHRGPYATLRETYGALEAHMKEAGLTMPPLAWEVYISDPGKVPEAELLTEIYMPVA